MFCVALLMDLFVLCVACLTVFVNCLGKQFTLFWGVVIILLLNVMELLSVGGSALCRACDPSVHLHAPSIDVCVVVYVGSYLLN